MAGFVQVYTGIGKVSSTAAIGLAVRALGAGWRVFFARFLKTGTYSEHEALARFSDRLTVKTYGRNVFIRDVPQDEDIRLAQEAMAELAEIVTSGRPGFTGSVVSSMTSLSSISSRTASETVAGLILNFCCRSFRLTAFPDRKIS